MKIGNLDISSFKVGGADCSIYLGNVKLYPSEEPTPTCETPENLETFALDDDFDTTKAVWNLWPDNLADLDGMTEEEEYYFTGYVVLSEDGENSDYTIVASITEEDGWTVDICEYDENGENFAGNVLTALTEDFFICMCDYFNKPMYVMDFSQYLIGEWSEMDDNTFDLSSPIYKVKMNAQDIYDTYGIDTFSGGWGDLNGSSDGMATAYEVDYNVELVDDHLEVSIEIYEDWVQTTSFTFDLSSEEVIIDFNALFGKPLYAGSCNMLCVDGDDEDCQEYAPLWSAYLSDGTKINEFEVEAEGDDAWVLINDGLDDIRKIKVDYSLIEDDDSELRDDYTLNSYDSYEIMYLNQPTIEWLMEQGYGGDELTDLYQKVGLFSTSDGIIGILEDGVEYTSIGGVNISGYNISTITSNYYLYTTQ